MSRYLKRKPQKLLSSQWKFQSIRDVKFISANLKKSPIRKNFILYGIAFNMQRKNVDKLKLKPSPTFPIRPSTCCLVLFASSSIYCSQMRRVNQTRWFSFCVKSTPMFYSLGAAIARASENLLSFWFFLREL